MTGYKNYKKIIFKKLLPQKGQIVVATVLFLTCLLGITALTVDAGSLYQKRGFYQTVADSAALAGAQELPESREYAVAAAVDYAQRNNVDISYNCRDYTSEEVEISSTLSPNDTITVTLSNREAPLYFAKIFGKDKASISAGAKAMAGKPIQVYGLVPWAAVIPEGEDWENWLGSVAGEEMVISGELEDTDFIAWDTTSHPGQWNQRYRNRIIDGYQEPLEAGDSIYTRDINIAQTINAVNERIDTWDGFNELIRYGDGGIIKLAENDDQFVIVPLIYDTELQEWWEEHPEDWPEVWVDIVAFAPFIITEIDESGPGHGHGHGHGHGSNAQVIGRFIHQALIINESEEIGPAGEVGLRVIRLIR
jgi:hypothetical protein